MFKKVVLLFSLFYSASAFSITSYEGTIAKINIENGIVLIKVSTALTSDQRWSCGNPTAPWWDFAFDPKTDQGKAMLSFSLLAYSAGKTVSLTPEHADSLTPCSVAGNTQNVRSIVLQ